MAYRCPLSMEVERIFFFWGGRLFFFVEAERILCELWLWGFCRPTFSQSVLKRNPSTQLSVAGFTQSVTWMRSGMSLSNLVLKLEVHAVCFVFVVSASPHFGEWGFEKGLLACLVELILRFRESLLSRATFRGPEHPSQFLVHCLLSLHDRYSMEN